jgi:hypothetical protein
VRKGFALTDYHVYRSWFYVSGDDFTRIYAMPAEAAEFVANFDSRKRVKPIQFTARRTH